jgi:hypothetical protein
MNVVISWLLKPETWDLNISEAAALVAVFIAGVVQVYRLWRKRHPFQILITSADWQEKKSTLVLPLGSTQEFHLQAILLIARNIEILDLRLVERTWRCLTWHGWRPKFSLYRDMSGGNAEITGFFLRQGSSEDEKPSRLAGKVREFVFPSAQVLSQESSLWLRTNINVYKNWKGYISLQLVKGDNARGYGRCRAIFGNPPTWLERLEPWGLNYEPTPDDRR